MRYRNKSGSITSFITASIYSCNLLFTAYMIWICYSVCGDLDIIVDWFKNTFGAIKRFFKRKVNKA